MWVGVHLLGSVLGTVSQYCSFKPSVVSGANFCCHGRGDFWAWSAGEQSCPEELLHLCWDKHLCLFGLSIEQVCASFTALHCTKTYFTVVWVTSPSDKSQQSSWLSTRLRSFYSSVSVTSLVCLSIRLAAWLPLSSQVSQTKQSATLGGVIVGQTAHGSWSL